MLLVVGLLCGGLVSLLLLNVVLAQDSIRASELRSTNNQLRQKKEGLRHENMRREMPGSIAREAGGQRQKPDWDEMNVITPDHDSAAGGGTPSGQEPVPGPAR